MAINNIRSSFTPAVTTARASGAGAAPAPAQAQAPKAATNTAPVDSFSGKGGDDSETDDIIQGGLQALDQKTTFMAGDREMKISDALDKSVSDPIKADFAKQIQDLKNQNLPPDQLQQKVEELLMKYDASLGAAKQEDDNVFYQALGKMKEYADKIKEAIEG